jgi:hypothetical protein
VPFVTPSGATLMSAFGQKRTLSEVSVMSALPPKADIGNLASSSGAPQLRQLGDVRSDPPRSSRIRASHSPGQIASKNPAGAVLPDRKRSADIIGRCGEYTEGQAAWRYSRRIVVNERPLAVSLASQVLALTMQVLALTTPILTMLMTSLIMQVMMMMVMMMTYM